MEYKETERRVADLFPYLVMVFAMGFVTWYMRRMHRITAMISKIPGPPTLPLIGNAHLFFGLDMEGFNNIQLDLINTYGPTVRVWLGPFLWVNLAEPEHIEAILSSEYGTNKDPTYRFFKVHCDGIFVASGDRWRKLRKMVNPTFHQKLLENFLTTFNEQSDELVQKLEEQVGKPTFDIGEYTGKCTLDFLCGTLMGVKTEEQIENRCDFAKNLVESVTIIKKRFYTLHYQSDWIFNCTELSKQLNAFVKPLHDFVKQVILERKNIKQSEDPKDGFVNVDVVQGKNRSIYLDTVLEQFKHLSNDELTYLTTDLFIAGADTTKVATAYTFALLGSNPDIQEKVYQEVNDVVGDGEFNMHKLASLPYMEMVLKEVLRLFTIPAIVRQLERDHNIGDITLPAGTSVQICFYAVHRDSRFWRHPEKFHPDHFLPEEVAKRPRYCYLPFGYGPRNCPGYAFAMLSMKTMVGSVIRKYRITSDLNLENAEYNNIFMLELKNGYPVQLTKR
ncbi:cytochrome P450 4C1-like isoform X2 [Nilaparvata lugens]|uniref:cytochrome P450 4C1-like isoform X2 n=1 Tax=Nilaparvata lugens TaxID=108931 RepID=UPI00193DB842|nr:cytochrome P450 4C1-like isoform X2 [Nilaparvata lugens]